MPRAEKPPERKKPFSLEEIGQCLRSVEMALSRQNKGEAIAVIERIFKAEEKPTGDPLNWSLIELGLCVRTANACERNGVTTVRQLCEVSVSEIQDWKMCGWYVVAEIRNALAKVGLRLRGGSVGECVLAR